MAIHKAVKWMPFLPQTPTSPVIVQKPALEAPLTVPDEKQFGLENFGNTCYANSVLQALYFCSPFRDLVLQSTDLSAPTPPTNHQRTLLSPTPPPLPPPRRKSDRPKTTAEIAPPPPPTPFNIPTAPPTLFSALRSLFLFISKNPSDKGAVAPSAFIDKLKESNESFRGSMHQDAHEFLNYLLNKIVEEIQGDKNHKDGSFDGSGEDLSTSIATLSTTAPPTTHSASSDHGLTLVHRLFEGTLTSETRCLTCETVSSRDESFLDLSIDIEQNSSVTACLRQFSASEMLCQKNKFFCDSCCGLQEAEKRMKIKKLPNVLALHLKRFKYQEDVQKYIKLAYRVAFPFELRLFNTVDDAQDPDRLYELFAIVVHIGSGPSHGHYITIVKGPHSWLVFDDHKIDPIKESEIPKYFGDSPAGSAYVLYYQAVDVDPAALGIKATVLATATVAATTALNGADLSVDALADAEASPAVPPGLSGEAAQSAPATPLTEPVLSPAIPAPIPSPAVSHRTSQPVLRVATDPTLPDPASISPTTPNGRGLGASQTMRSPVKPTRLSAEESLLSPGGSLGRGSTGDARRPSTAQGLVGVPEKPEVVPPVPPIPDLPHVQVNGKEPVTKEVDRKPSLWFKRRSLKKDDKDKDKDKGKNVGTSSAPSFSSSSQSPVPDTISVGSMWRRSSVRLANHTKRLSASMSSPNIADPEALAASSLPPMPPTPAVLGSPNSATPSTTTVDPCSSPELKPSRGTDSMSAASSIASSSSPILAPQSHPHPPSDSPLPPPASPNGGPSWRVQPASPASPGTSSSPPSSYPVAPQHKQSVPLLGYSHRPATVHAGAIHRSTTLPGSAPSAPTISGSPASPVPSDVSDGADADVPRGRSRRSAPGLPLWRPHSAHAHTHGKASPVLGPLDAHADPGPNGDATPVAALGESPAKEHGGAAGLKRAARKLSLTAPMFGLGREKREKREKPARPPSAFMNAATVTR